MMGFTYRGKHTSAIQGLVVKTITNPLLPARSIQRESVIGRDGEYVFAGGYNNKLLEFRCFLIGGTIYTRRQAAREIAAWLAETGDLVLDYESAKTYKVVKTLSDVPLTIEQAWEEFTLVFETEPLQYGKLKSLTFEDPVSVAVTNGGTYPAETQLSLTGSGDVSISWGEGSCTLSGLTGKVTMDSKRLLVYAEPAVKEIAKHTGDFLRLKPGKNSIAITGTADSMTVQFHDTYL